ncbi:MAG TPA: hypothetical protein DC047_11000 [Blastocatellia bacterium]|nr:hypothetical protein [Blastocatellia bacterium]
MLAGKTPHFNFTIGIIVGFVVALALAAFTTKAFFVRKQIPINKPFLTEGFDFNPLRSAENEWRGPEIGENIDLTRLKKKDGTTLASVVGKRPVALVLVNPTCSMCKTASDEMRYLHQKLESMDINYYVVSFAPPPQNVDFFKYSDSLGVGAPSFLWDATGGAPPSSAFRMTVPSHLLTNSDGVVICAWPGSNENKAIRDRMAQQIVADTLVAANTARALIPNASANH